MRCMVECIPIKALMLATIKSGENGHTSAVKIACRLKCWPSPSNQKFYTQIAGYQRGVGDHGVGQ